MQNNIVRYLLAAMVFAPVVMFLPMLSLTEIRNIRPITTVDVFIIVSFITEITLCVAVTWYYKRQGGNILFYRLGISCALITIRMMLFWSSRPSYDALSSYVCPIIIVNSILLFRYLQLRRNQRRCGA